MKLSTIKLFFITAIVLLPFCSLPAKACDKGQFGIYYTNNLFGGLSVAVQNAKTGQTYPETKHDVSINNGVELCFPQEKDGYKLMEYTSRGNYEYPLSYQTLVNNGYYMKINAKDSNFNGNNPNPFPDAPIATPAVYPGTNTPIFFKTAGIEIQNDQGTRVLLKGFARPSLEWSPTGQGLSVDDFTNMRKWKANVIRIDLNQEYWLKSGPETQKGSYRQIVNAMVYYAIQNNMAVILDLHWLTTGQTPMADQKSLEFWTQVSNEYKNFGTVMFELFNEPNNITPDVWLNGNNEYEGYQQLYNAVRATGAKNICIINGLDWGYDLSFVNPNFGIKGGYNFMYGSHPYDGKGASDYTGPGGSFANNFKGIINNYPLIFTEFGADATQYYPHGYEEVYQRILTYAKEHAISYTAYAWWVETDAKKNPNTFPDMIDDWTGTPLNGGVLVQEDMKSAPGIIDAANNSQHGK